MSSNKNYGEQITILKINCKRTEIKRALIGQSSLNENFIK
jgi:hypothetical protein